MSTKLSVYCRAYTPISETQTRAIAAARAVDVSGRVDDCEINEWPATVSLQRDCEPVRVYERIREWADEVGVDVDAPFRIHSRIEPVTGNETTVLHTPVVCATLERDGELVGSAPCTLPDETHVTVREFLDALVDGEDPLGDGTTVLPTA